MKKKLKVKRLPGNWSIKDEVKVNVKSFVHEYSPNKEEKENDTTPFLSIENLPSFKLKEGGEYVYPFDPQYGEQSKIEYKSISMDDSNFMGTLDDGSENPSFRLSWLCDGFNKPLKNTVTVEILDENDGTVIDFWDNDTYILEFLKGCKDADEESRSYLNEDDINKLKSYLQKLKDLNLIG